jgi:hypothetical protein
MKRWLPWTVFGVLASFVWWHGQMDYMPGANWDGDSAFYMAMAHDPFGHNPYVYGPPYCWRILVPLLAHILPFSLRMNFWLTTLAGLALTTWAVSWLLKGFAQDAVLAGTLSFLLLGPATAFTLWDDMLVDPLAFAWITLAIAAMVHRRGWVLIGALVLGAFTKESILLAVGFALLWTIEQRDWAFWRWVAAGTIGCFGVLIELRP